VGLLWMLIDLTYIQNISVKRIRYGFSTSFYDKLLTGFIFEHYNFQNTLKSNKTIIMYNTLQIVKKIPCRIVN
jgi:hypothetical protein